MGRKATFFPHLHIHDDHSLKDGCATVETYADIAADLGGGSLAITNHGRASGYARQYFACKDRNLKPIFGMEAYINEHRRKPIHALLEELRGKEKRTRKQPAQNAQIKARIAQAQAFVKTKFRPSPHAIILAKTREGYRNLVRMSTDSWLNGSYYVPRTDTQFLAEHREGLVYSTACIGGYIPKMARANYDLAVAEARRLQAIFNDGGGGFFVELMMTEYEKQRETNRVMIKLASEINAPCIITCDVHYAQPGDGVAQDVLLLMRDKKTLEDVEKAKYEAGDGGGGIWQFEAKDLWWRTREDVARCWKNHHSDYMDRETFIQAMRNTYALADSIEHIEFDEGLKLPGVFSEPEFNLKELVKSGLRWRIDRGEIPASGHSKRDYVDRVKRELDVINGKGFAEYFLILHDICKAAREMGARMGPGRGSAGGSLIAYLCRITDIDPLRFNLLFERFLDAGRPDPPDIDLDFSPEHRDGIKDYVEKRYPATATIGSMATFKPRATLQNVGKVFGVDYRTMQEITKPLGTEADGLTWDEIFDLWPAVQRFADEYPEAWSVVKTLRGLNSHRGKNAAGMLIAPASALDEVPMIVEKNDDGNQTVTAFPDSQGDGVKYKGRELTRLGYLKADLLGVRNLNIAPAAADLVQRDTGDVIEIDSLPLDDPQALEVASSGDVPGVFQLDSNTTRPILRHVGVQDFADLVMVTALCRPGPLKHQVHRRFAKLKRDDSWQDDVVPDLRELLADSRGLMILQEDVMWVSQIVCGFTKEEANALRKITSKKHPEAMKLWGERFKKGGYEKGVVSREEIDDLWEKIETFAGYGFCKAHAVAYMLTAYRQLYMLAHHPIEYFAGLLDNTQRGKKDTDGGERLIRFLRAAMARGIRCVGPHVNGSPGFDVTPENEIRYGLSSVKGVANAAEHIVKHQPFKSLEDVFDRVERRRVNVRVVDSLILSGAMDSLEFNRHAGGEPIPDYDGVEVRNGLRLRYHQLTAKGKKKDEPPPKLIGAVLRAKEQELLGIALSWWSSNTVQEIRDDLGLETIAWHVDNDISRISVLAEVTKARTHKSRKGTMCFVKIADETGNLENITIWAEEWKDVKRYVKPGQIVVLKLRRRENNNKRYGEWAYYLEHRDGDAVQSLARALRPEAE